MSRADTQMSGGRFITFEGTEGVGKSTQIQHLEKFLKIKNIQCIVTREPGGTRLGEKIREMVLTKTPYSMDGMTELLLMFSARAQHLQEKIYPALAENIWVICDRFTDTSYAYQGGGRGISFAAIKMIETATQDHFKPDVTILLSGDIEKGLRRVSRRGEKDRLESEDMEFFKRVHDCYLALAKEQPGRFDVIDADQTVEQVALAIQAGIKKRFAKIIEQSEKLSTVSQA